jgi:hypothetical protein
MDKILQTIRVLAENGDEDANAVFREIDGMNQNELADYVYTHDAQLRKILGVKNLVEKEGNPEFTKEYFDLLNQGRAMNNRDKYTKNDVYNQKLKDVPYYMEKFGLPKEKGEYSLEDQIKFANSVSNLDSDELANLAWLEGFEGDADQMRNEIKRTGERLIGDIARKGLNPETGSAFYWKYPLHVAKALAAPRITEAYESGQEPGIKDVIGDEAEMALNFIPGMSAVSKGVRGLSKVSKLPKVANSLIGKPLNKMVRDANGTAARVVGELAESAATPVGSQLTDMALYEDSDPRGNWDWGRVGAQYGGAVGMQGAVKMAGARAKQLLEQEGKEAASSTWHGLADAIDNIGNDARENIARRQLVMERKAEMANDPQYNSQRMLTPEQAKSGYFGKSDDLVDREDFNIRKSEAERLVNTMPEREQFFNILDKNGLRQVPLDEIRVSNPEIYSKLEPLIKKIDADAPAIYQLPDGRYVSGKTVADNPIGELDYNTFDDGTKYSNLTNMLKNEQLGSDLPMYSMEDIEFSTKPRDIGVRKELANDRDFNAIVNGTADRQPFVNTATHAGFNAAAREGIVGEGLDLDDKRESALWNRQLDQLRPLVQQGEPEYKRQMVDAIMNVMTYGEDLPEDMYKQNRNAYDAIAQRLGISYNNSFKEVADYPTTSYSSAR